MNEPKADARNRSWRRLIPRLSVRAMMILVLILGGGFGWLVRSVRVQRDAVAAVLEAGGSVKFDWVWGDDDPPAWLASIINVIGRDYFQYVECVSLGQSDPDALPINDALLAQVGRLTGLDTLSLNDCENVTAAGLAHLQGLTSLTFLRLDNMSPEVYNAGLTHLGGLVNLEVLSLQSPHVTSADLAALRDMRGLEHLYLGNSGVDDLVPIQQLKQIEWLELTWTPITDAGLAPLGGMSRLNHLDLSHTKINGAGLAYLQNLSRLNHLDLTRTMTNDAGLTHLQSLNSLSVLSLEYTSIKDAGLAHLRGMKDLEFLDLSETGITDAGLVHLQNLPLLGLKLDGTRVTDAGLAHLAGLTRLERLFLNRTVVGDKGLKHLAGLKLINELWIKKTRVTDAGINELLRLSPSMQIHASGEVDEVPQSPPAMETERSPFEVEPQ